ncbi:MAG: DUF4936 family protein [Betaproteobacteria bacterium]|nr:DUF4936 family protein [Betaproteobacteria bacterium]
MGVPRAAEHVYVYYRLQGDPSAARAAVARLFADVEARTGIGGRLLERHDAPRTWMEVYEPVPRPATFLRLLDAAVRRHGLAAFAVDARRATERFGVPRAAGPRAAAR